MKKLPTALGVLALAVAGGLSAACARQAVVDSGPGEVSASPDEALIVELRRLANRQESYFSEQGQYADQLEALDFSAAPGILLDVLEAHSAGFSAIATAEDGSSECAYFIGNVRPPRSYVRVPDQVGCRS